MNELEKSMIKSVVLFFVFVSSVLYSKTEDFLSKLPEKHQENQIRNVDFIYMINLDERPEKYQHSLQELAPYGISPYRFSAVNGWNLSLETINAVGTPYEPRMGSEHWGTSYLIQDMGQPSHEIMQSVGKVYFAHCLSRGAIGIVLSHLSILQDAYDSGYKTIWVMEDDVEVIRDPHILSDLIDELDAIVGKEGWDILFTDQDTKGHDGKYVSCLSCAWRPDLPHYNSNQFTQRYYISSNLRRIGARYGSYSMIVRRSGMKKILDFFKSRHLFLPFDMEFTLPPRIRLFNVNDDVVSTMPRALTDNGYPGYSLKH